VSPPIRVSLLLSLCIDLFALFLSFYGIGVNALMIGGGIGKKSRRGKHASSYDGKSPEEIRKVKKARKAALEKARRMNQSQQKADKEKEKDRAREKQKREDMSCSFEKTKVWEVPGKDYYNDVDFENNPEVAVQLWYDNNGTCLLRES